METRLVRQSTPEEEELLRKREDLAEVRAILTERELDLAELRAQLRSFEGRYLRMVGFLYAELDEWEAKVAEVQSQLNPSGAASQRVQEARERASDTRSSAYGEASKAQEFQPSADLKRLFREIAKCIHPDFAMDENDRLHRTKVMAQVNEAYSLGDAAALQRLVEEFGNSPDSVCGEGIGAQLVRLIRQIHQAKKNIALIEETMESLRTSELAQLQQECEEAQKEGRDLFAELAAAVQHNIDRAKTTQAALSKELENRERQIGT